ncbi:MAG: hypothetical protein AWM53_01976 [Candidatus Dichloromethanomonas elyunquensis]|nr:MAG: hypothetical protein AWM53_01976 [Candidatus Dichloromethanomonas elyunquensis]
MFSRKTNISWWKMSSAVLGGFLLGFSYKKYGREIKHQIRRLGRNQMDYDDFISSHESDA